MIFRNADSSDCEAVAHLHALSGRRSGILAQQFLDTFAEDDGNCRSALTRISRAKTLDYSRGRCRTTYEAVVVSDRRDDGCALRLQ